MIIWRNNGTDNIHIDLVQLSKYKEVPDDNILNTYVFIERRGGGEKLYLSSHYLDAEDVAQPRITTRTDRFCLYSVIDSTLLSTLKAGYYTAKFFSFRDASLPTENRKGLQDANGTTIADATTRNGTFLVSELLLTINEDTDTIFNAGSNKVADIVYPTTDIED